MQPLQNRRAAFDQAAVVLRKISNRRFVSPNHFSRVHKRSVIAAGLAQLGFRRGRRIRQQRIHQSRLPRSIAPHQRDSFPARNARREVAYDRFVSVSLAQVLDFENVFSRRPLLLELDIRPLDIRPGQFRHLQPFHFLAPRLHLARSRTG